MEVISFMAGAVTALLSLGMFLLMFKVLGLTVVPAPSKTEKKPALRPDSMKLAEVAAQNPGLAQVIVSAEQALKEADALEQKEFEKAKKDLDAMAEEAATRMRGMRTEIDDPFARAFEEVI